METTKENQLATLEEKKVSAPAIDRVPHLSAFSVEGFDHAQRVAVMLAKSSLVPKDFQNNVQNVMIALELAHRISASPFMVMQNLYVINGRPSWSSQFIIAALNSCKRFSPLRFELTGAGDDMSCFAWAYELDTKEKIIGPTVSMKMAKAEGWLTKSGSKWQTMPDHMIRFRAAAFFGRLYAPDILMGMQATDEVQDIEGQEITASAHVEAAPVEEITFETLQALYDEKLALLTKSEMDNAKRILSNKEVDSYAKLYKFLSDKVAA